MELKKINDRLYVGAQITISDVDELKAKGFGSIICNRPDGEAPDQPSFAEIKAAAEKVGIQAHYLPITPGSISDTQFKDFAQMLEKTPEPVLAYCRSGTRSTTLWSLGAAIKRPVAEILATAKAAGYDLANIANRMAGIEKSSQKTTDAHHAIVIVGGGAAGISVAASLKARNQELDIAIIDPADVHYYQPGWTLVGAGVFTPAQTARTMASVIPKGVKWIKTAVVSFEPENNIVTLEGKRSVSYDRLIVCPGIKLDWGAVEGLEETLGKNGVTSNYRFDLAPYTWELVQNMRSGRAIFTQPPMPIKCAGAPQKALYLSADSWFRNGTLTNIDIQFNNAGGVLFGVKDYVPSLMEYVQKYNAQLNFFYNLIAIDGVSKKATFRVSKPDTEPTTVEMDFDMIHVCPPQCAPDFIRTSPLADTAGWVDVSQETLRHTKYKNIWSLGDVSNTPNAKTAAAARKQAPVVAQNIIADIEGHSPTAQYDGYGSCPLTVERGKIVLAEFGYGGVLKPSFPKLIIDGTKPSSLAWFLKETLLPPIYWKAMLKGHEWMAGPTALTTKIDDK